MRFENLKGEHFKLRVLGYEFPDIIHDKWDSNWLKVEVVVTHKYGSWTAIDSCLLTFEIKRLAKWFDDISRNSKQLLSVQEFLDPSLKFILISDQRLTAIRVYFELNLRPTWNPAKTMKKPMEDLWIDFPIEVINFREVIHSLNLQLEQYPERAANQ